MNLDVNDNQENFSSPVNYKMGPYTDIVLDNDKYRIPHPKYIKDKPDTKCNWRKRPCDVQLHSDINFVAPVGIETRYVEDPDHSKSFPTVDGTKDGKRSLFMFTHNQCHPDCCPSTYSCDKGCVCTTKQQRKLLNRRGYNRNSDIYPGI